MKSYVLDSWAVVEWLHARSPSDQVVQKSLADAEAGHAQLFMSAINVGEVYYALRKSGNDGLAQDWVSLAKVLPVTIKVPCMEDIWDAATLKGQYPISYADGFAADLALKHKCPLMTGDREFRVIPQLKLLWLGPA